MISPLMITVIGHKLSDSLGGAFVKVTVRGVLLGVEVEWLGCTFEARDGSEMLTTARAELKRLMSEFGGQS